MGSLAWSQKADAAGTDLHKILTKFMRHKGQLQSEKGMDMAEDAARHKVSMVIYNMARGHSGVNKSYPMLIIALAGVEGAGEIVHDAYGKRSHAEAWIRSVYGME